ncbi:MAG: N-acetylmuramoyl-L-alanine amidase [Actinocatenispora sp.]
MDQQRPALGRRGLFKASLGAATVAVLGAQIAGTEAAGAAPSALTRPVPMADLSWIIGCDDWSARPPSSPVEISTNVTNKIIVHHMAFPNSTDYSQAHAKQLARDCQDLHMDTNGWSDTGQHFTVSRGGFVTEGRHRSKEKLGDGSRKQVVGAHCPGENGNAIGIENEGTYVTATPPQALITSLTKLCVTICQQYGLHAWDVFGHWDFRDTECPGAAFYREFPMLRRKIAAGLGEAPADAPARRWPDIWKFVGGPVVKVTQYLLNDKGYSLPTDGVFGASTVAAVQDWQSRNGLPVDPDATMTTKTWETLVPALASGSTGQSVRGLQYILNHKGYANVSVTGTVNAATTAAVKDLQTVHGLSATGKVDTTTWCAVVGGIVRQAFSG